MLVGLSRYGRVSRRRLFRARVRREKVGGLSDETEARAGDGGRPIVRCRSYRGAERGIGPLDSSEDGESRSTSSRRLDGRLGTVACMYIQGEPCQQ